MIRAAGRLLALGLIELGLASIVVAAGLLYLAFRLLRRFVTDNPDGLEAYARSAAALLAAAAAAKATPKDT